MDMYRKEVLTFSEKVAQKKEFFIYDTETTGLSPVDSDIIEFACLKVAVEERGFVIKDTLDVYINIGYPLPEIITNITGITDAELLENGISPKEAADRISSFLGDTPILAGYNSVKFDTGFVKKLFENAGISFEYLFQLDVLTMAKEKTPKPHKLCDMAEKAGVKDITFHRALADCQATLEVFKYLLPMYAEPEDRAEIADIKIMGVRRWTKSHTLDRLYVQNSKNISLYYDVYTKSWNVGENCDINSLAEMVRSFAGVKTDAELVAMY